MRSDAELLVAARSRCGRVPRALRALRRARLRLPPAPQPGLGRRARPDGGDVRAGLAVPYALPRRGGRLRRALAVRHRPARAARERAPAPARAQRVRAPRRARRRRPRAAAAAREERWLDGLDEALAHLPEAQREAIRLRVRRGPRLRRGGRAPRDHAPGRARARLARPERPPQAPFRSDGEHPMTQLDPSSHALGDRLERAAAADLAAAPAAAARRPRRVSRRLAVVVAALAIVVPGVAIAGRTADQHRATSAQSMPAGTLALAGTEPTCTVVTKDVEYHCVLAKAPAPEVDRDWKGTVEPTRRRDQARQRRLPLARAATAREWQCYIGQEAVDQQIIGAGLPRRVRADAPAWADRGWGQARTVWPDPAPLRSARAGPEPRCRPRRRSRPVARRACRRGRAPTPSRRRR